MVNEIWKPITGFDGQYEVSNMGRVRSNDWTHTRTNKNGLVISSLKKGKIFKCGPNSAGYPQVSLRGRFYLVHKLVAQEFIGPCPEGQEVRHKDGCPGNPRWDNLLYGTRSQNMLDCWDHDTHQGGERNSMSKLTSEDVLNIRARAASGEKQRDIAKDYKVHFGNINAIILRKSWRHI